MMSITKHPIEWPPFFMFRIGENVSAQEDTLVNAVNLGCKGFIIAAETSNDFANAYKTTLHQFDQRHPQNQFVFVPSIDTSNETSEMIFHHSFSIDIPDILIIKSMTNSTFSLITNEFVGRDITTSKQLILDTYDGNTKTFASNGTVNLFPNKLLNLQGRPLKLTLINYKPYALWFKTEPGFGNANFLGSNEEKDIFIDGTEPTVFLEYCAKYNCTLEVWPGNEGEWGETYSNGSGYGLLGAISNRIVDFGVSALFVDWIEEYRHLHVTPPLTRASITVLAPKPLLKPRWQLPALPFSVFLWVAVFASILITAASFVIIDVVQKESFTKHKPIEVCRNFFKSFGILLGQDVKESLGNPIELIIIGMVLLISMIIDSAYTGGLASVLTRPRYEDPIDSIHQLAEKGWNWGGVTEAYVFSIELAQEPDVIHALELFQIKDQEQLAKRVTTGDFSFTIERLQYGHFAFFDFITPEAMDYLRIMRDDLFFTYTVSMAYKTCPLLQTLNPMVLNIVQSGLMRHWEFKTSLNYLNNNLQERVFNSRQEHTSEEITSLKVSHLIGVFLVLIFGHLTAFIVFVGEHFINFIKKKKIIVN